jgi:hypothetical protein
MFSSSSYSIGLASLAPMSMAVVFTSKTYQWIGGQCTGTSQQDGLAIISLLAASRYLFAAVFWKSVCALAIICSKKVKVTDCSSSVPQHLKGLRYGTYALCTLITCLGITLTCLWLFGCEPFVSNFLWSVLSTECLNPDIIRWRECYTFPLIEKLLLIFKVWVGVSIPIDAILVIIPLQYVRVFILLLLIS